MLFEEHGLFIASVTACLCIDTNLVLLWFLTRKVQLKTKIVIFLSLLQKVSLPILLGNESWAKIVPVAASFGVF